MDTIETTTLIQNEEESFALAPVKSVNMGGQTRAKRKRKLIVDEVKAICGEEMKSRLIDTCDIVTMLEIAPPTRRLMQWKESGALEKLFSMPGRMMQAQCIRDDFSANLVMRSENLLESFSDNDLNLEQVHGFEEFRKPLPMGKKKSRKKRPKNGEVVISEYAKRQAQLAAAVEEDARKEREKTRAREMQGTGEGNGNGTRE